MNNSWTLIARLGQQPQALAAELAADDDTDKLRSTLEQLRDLNRRDRRRQPRHSRRAKVVPLFPRR